MKAANAVGLAFSLTILGGGTEAIHFDGRLCAQLR
jgi:hypothetical protein